MMYSVPGSKPRGGARTQSSLKLRVAFLLSFCEIYGRMRGGYDYSMGMHVLDLRFSEQ